LAILRIWSAVFASAIALSAHARADERQTASEVHERGGYPSEIEIGATPSECAIGSGGGSEHGGEDPNRDARDDGGDGLIGTDTREPAANSAFPGSTSGGDPKQPGSSGEARGSDEPGRPALDEPPPAEPDEVELRPPTPVVFSLGALPAIVLVVAIALALAFLLWLVARRRSPAGAPDEPSIAAPQPIAERPVLEDFEAHARRGEFDAAIRALLVAALMRAGWTPLGSDAARTAREVVRRLPATDPRREPLSEIVLLAEAVRFAGQPASEERFASMRRAFGMLADA
jgi:hypothetical protein